jgi:hypothetical protein
MIRLGLVFDPEDNRPKFTHELVASGLQCPKLAWVETTFEIQEKDSIMDQKIDRRTFIASTGALGGITVGGFRLSALAQDGTPVSSPAASPAAEAETGTISGTVVDLETDDPLADVYVVIGWEDVQLAGITDAEGRYTVANVPVGETVDVLGFREGGYRYYNSLFDADMEFELEPGETITHDFGLAQLNQPEGEPELSDPLIDPERVMPGDEVTFEVTAKNGAGGLSPEIIAANPEVGRMVLMEPVGDDRFRATVTFSNDIPPGDYSFAFFAASVECFVNSEFPMVTLHIEGAEATPAAISHPVRS